LNGPIVRHSGARGASANWRDPAGSPRDRRLEGHDRRSRRFAHIAVRSRSRPPHLDAYVLDNITLTWLTNTAISGARLYWENKGASFFAVKGVAATVPVAVSVFPDELYPAPRSWAERAYANLIHYNKVDKGGHFAAWEQPKLFTEELRAGFRPLRK
jgi:pimeloyl-ACP methyl ester carboxylesterase